MKLVKCVPAKRDALENYFLHYGLIIILFSINVKENHVKLHAPISLGVCGGTICTV